MYIVKIEHEDLLYNFYYETKDDAVRDITKFEKEQYDNETFKVYDNIIVGKYDKYYIIKLEKREI